MKSDVLAGHLFDGGEDLVVLPSSRLPESASVDRPIASDVVAGLGQGRLLGSDPPAEHERRSATLKTTAVSQAVCTMGSAANSTTTAR